MESILQITLLVLSFFGCVIVSFYSEELKTPFLNDKDN